MLDHPTTFGRMLRVVREDLGYSQRRLAKAAGVSSSIICQVESGKVAYLGLPAAYRAACALGVTLDFLMADPDEPAAPPPSAGAPQED